MAKLVVFVDHDIMLRHFVLSGVLPALEGGHDVVYVFPERHRRVTADLAGLPIRTYRTVPISETRLYRYRRLYHTTSLKMLRGTSDRRVIFAFWRPTLCLFGAYFFGAFTALPFALQSHGVTRGSGLYPMIPYLAAVVALVLVSSRAARLRFGAPGALGLPYVREER